MSDDRPPHRHRVALLGFGPFELGALASYLRLATHRSPAYVQVASLVEADFVVADADHQDAMDAVFAAGRVGDSVFIGARAPDGALGWLMRPIDPMQLLRELDGALSQRAHHPAGTPTRGLPPVFLTIPVLMPEPATSPPVASAQWLADAPAHGPASAPASAPVPAPATAPAPVLTSAAAAAPTLTPASARLPDPAAPVSLFALPSPPMSVIPPALAARKPAGTVRNRARRASDAADAKPRARLVSNDVLVVDHSAIALRHLELQLQALGLRPVVASNSTEALELLAQQRFGFVFSDIELGDDSELDGLALCREIKNQKLPVGGVLPVVMLLSDQVYPEDRVRGTLAGCDACLGKPLEDEALRQVLNRHGARLAAPVAPAAPDSGASG